MENMKGCTCMCVCERERERQTERERRARKLFCRLSKIKKNCRDWDDRRMVVNI